jgi:starch-binding outer membrane protein, SusD/RagB family
VFKSNFRKKKNIDSVMKRTVYVVFVSVVLGLSFGCQENFLELQKKDQLGVDNFYQTGEHAFKATIACYNRLKSWELYGFKYFYFWNSWSDEGIFERGSYQAPPTLFNNEQKEDIFRVYANLNIGIYTCNVALKKIPDIDTPDLSDAQKNIYLREVSFLRAFYHFLLTVYFNEPPLVTEPIEDPAYIFENASREEFYEQIVSDLEFSIAEGKPDDSRLPVNWGTDWVGRITRGQAMAFLGKVYLYKAAYAPAEDVSSDYKNASKYLKMCIDVGEYDLIMPEGNEYEDFLYAYLCNFTENGFDVYPGENNRESVFEIQYGKNITSGWESGYTTDAHRNNPYFAPTGWQNIAPTQKLANKFEATNENDPANDAGFTFDPRRDATLYEEGDSIIFKSGSSPIVWSPNQHLKSASEGIGWKKYFYPVGPVDNLPQGTNNIRVIRFSDVLLMYAEAEYNLGNDSDNSPWEGGLWALNYVRERVGMSPVSELSPQVIMDERSREFGLEGLRYHDLVRWTLREPAWTDFSQEINTSTSFVGGFEKGKHEFLPIPVSELDINKGLDQNPGY